MDYTALRTELHRAIDAILDTYLKDVNELDAEDLVIVPSSMQPDFDYQFPTLPPEHFHDSQWYDVTGPAGPARLLAARTEREAWGKTRSRVVIFLRGNSDNPASFYPVVEFAQSDLGEFACGIPDPAHPRASLKDGDEIPDQYKSAHVVRADQAFHSIRTGPSLRLLINEHDVPAMVAHGYGVAKMRARI